MSTSGNGPTVAKAYVSIIPSMVGAQKTISSALIPISKKVGDEAGNTSGEHMSGGIASALHSATGKLTAIVTRAIAAAGIGKIFKDIVSSYSQWEQMEGGVRAIFGVDGSQEAADIVIKNAQKAFKTAQVSANDYMETVTGFSARLIQSVGGDSVKAANIADKAMIDMADNYNRFGTSMSSIRAAYEGFARGQYTMLDNLKLGYSGSATEMARLINESGILGDTLIDLEDTQNVGKVLQRVGFDKMIEAIHVVQERIGVSGTAATEAEHTIQGSINRLRASWDNLLLAFGKGDTEEIGISMRQFVESLTIALQNLLPRIGIILLAIIKEVPSAVAFIIENLPGWLSEIGAAIQAHLPDMLAGVADVLGIDLERTLQTPVVQSVLSLSDRVSEAFSQVFGEIDLSQTLADIQTGLSDLGDFVKEFSESASIEISKFLDSIDTASLVQGFETLKAAGAGLISILRSVGEIVGTVLQTVVLPVLSNIWDVLTTTIWPWLQDIFKILQPILMTIGDILVTGFDWLTKIAAIIGEVLGPEIDALFAREGPKLSQIIDAIKFVLMLLGEDFKRSWEIVKPIIGGFIDSMLSAFRAFGPEIERLKTTIFNTIRTIVISVIPRIIRTVSEIAGNISGTFWNIVSAISDAFSRVYDIITSPFRAAFNAIRQLWNSTIGGFSFSVPSWIPVVGGRTFRIPYLATGGDITTAGTVMVGEAGPELLSLPRGARVTPLSDATTQSGNTYSVIVGDVDLTDDDQVRRVTREYLEFLARLASPSSMVIA